MSRKAGNNGDAVPGECDLERGLLSTFAGDGAGRSKNAADDAGLDLKDGLATEPWLSAALPRPPVASQVPLVGYQPLGEGEELSGLHGVPSGDSLASMASSASSTDDAPSDACSRFSLVFFPWLLIIISMVSKGAMTYFGAKTFNEKNNIDSWSPALATTILYSMPSIDGFRNFFLKAGKGGDSLKKLIRQPGKQLGAFGSVLCKHPVLSLIVAARIVGEAIMGGMVMSTTFNNWWGEPVSAEITAMIVAAMGAFSDITFGGEADLRLLQRMTCQPIVEGLTNEEGILASKIFKRDISALLATPKGCYKVRQALNKKIKKIEEGKVTKKSLFSILYCKEQGLDEKDMTAVEKRALKNLRVKLVKLSANYSCEVSSSARLTSLMVNLPFFFLSFLKNEEFAKKHHWGATGALIWAVVQAALKLMTSQGKPVEGASDSYSHIGKGVCRRMAKAVCDKPHAALFSLLAFIPFSIFGTGLILSMPDRFDWMSQEVALAVVGTFLAFNIPSFLGYLPPRIYKAMPACSCCNGESHGVDGDTTDELLTPGRHGTPMRSPVAGGGRVTVAVGPPTR